MFSHFKLSECEDVSILNIILVKFSCFLVALFRIPSCRGGGGGGKLSRLVYLAPHPPGYQSKIIGLILLILNYLVVKKYQF